MGVVISDWITWIDIYRSSVPKEVLESLKHQYTYKDVSGLYEHLYSIDSVENQCEVFKESKLVEWFGELEKAIDDKFNDDLAPATPAYFRIID